MTYNILGVCIRKNYSEKLGWEIYVAWQSNLPEFSFSWRVTMTIMDQFPTQDDLHKVAARGDSVIDKKIVKGLFPFINVKNLTY